MPRRRRTHPIPGLGPGDPAAPLAPVMEEIVNCITPRLPRGWIPFLFLWNGGTIVGVGLHDIEKSELIAALRDWCDQEDDN